jgi:hypothetical protein
VLAVVFSDSDDVLVMRAETLLQLARGRKDGDLQWREWGVHVTWVQQAAASGFLVLDYVVCSRSTLGNDTFDFSAQAPVGCTETSEGGEVRRFVPGVTQALPRRKFYNTTTAYGCHDSLTFVLVNLPTPLALPETD